MLVLVLILAWFVVGGAVAVYIEGAIDGTAVTLVERAVVDAEARGLPLVVVLNTYGGYLGPMDRIVEILLNAKVPTYAYIPRGGKAMSAGAFVAMAASKIYMDPTAQIGAAEPRPPDPKVVNYAAARMKALAQRKWSDERVEVAVSFVVENKALTGSEAIDLGIAEPPPAFNFVAEYRKDPLSQLLSALSDPAVLTALLIVGLVLVAYEVATGGFQGVGAVGAVLIVLALYLSGQIGVHWLAALLALVGAGLIVAEMFTGSGVFLIGGVAAVALALYFAAAGQPYHQSESLNYVVAGILGAVAVAAGYLGYKVRMALSKKPQSYAEDLPGARGVAKTAIGPGKKGVVYVAGEEWSAESQEEILPGEEVEVAAVEGLTLKVKKVKK